MQGREDGAEPSSECRDQSCTSDLESLRKHRERPLKAKGKALKSKRKGHKKQRERPLKAQLPPGSLAASSLPLWILFLHPSLASQISRGTQTPLQGKGNHGKDVNKGCHSPCHPQTLSHPWSLHPLQPPCNVPVTNRTPGSLRPCRALGEDCPLAGGCRDSPWHCPKGQPLPQPQVPFPGRCHMRAVALPRCHQLAETPLEEGGKCSRGLQNTRRAGDSLRGFPCLGQLSPALPTLQHSPCWGLCCALPPSQFSSSSQNPHWALWSPHFPPFPSEAAFPSPQIFASGFAALSLKHPRHSQGWRCLDVFS